MESMDTIRPSNPKRHSKHGSVDARRVTMPRRSTKGPLDDEYIPNVSVPKPGVESSSSSSPRASFQSPQSSGILPPNSNETSDISKRDFSKLLRPEIYHQISHLDTPSAFRTPNLQPSPDTPLPKLLQQGQFRAAAILSAALLTTSTSPTDAPQIFYLFYTRLATLNLIGATVLAAQESKALEDMNSAIYRDPETGANLIPWELRVLAVRLQSIGFGDWRRGIMAYYEMAREARDEASRASETESVLWLDRLSDLGLRVGNALVEMGDLEGAVRHLEGLRGGVLGVEEDRTLRMRLSLLFLKIGDISAARRCFLAVGERDPEDYQEHRILSALCSMAEGKYEHATLEWRRLCETVVQGREMCVQNLAVCLLYCGELDEARQLLEGLVDEGNSFHGLTFNLSTIYELCTEKSRILKLQLADRVAEQVESGNAWEKSNMDFKL